MAIEMKLRSKSTESKEPLYRIEAKEAVACSNTELVQFVKLVKDGDEVSDGLGQRVKSAASLAMMFSGVDMVGTAAVKRPAANYRNKVFRSAQTDKAPQDYPFELGWIYISPAHRDKRQTIPLIKAAMGLLDEVSMFATTKKDNQLMHQVL